MIYIKNDIISKEIACVLNILIFRRINQNFNLDIPKYNLHQPQSSTFLVVEL